MSAPLRITVLGLSITSSWGNGHATTYRGLVRELVGRGHDVTFLERDVPWYAAHRDLPHPPWGRTVLYQDLAELRRHRALVRDADLVIVGSYVPEGSAAIDWVQQTARGATAFYDIDTPVTLAQLGAGNCDYLAAAQIPRFALYLSFTGGPTLELLETHYQAQAARALYCSVDPGEYFPPAGSARARWDLGYMGTYSDDRQPTLERLLLVPARRWAGGRFVVAGPQYPGHVAWPRNVERIEHLPPAEHRGFYAAQRYTLNVTRAAMIRAGWSPSVRLFEAAACATPIISDAWPGLDSVLRVGTEVLVARTAREVIELVVDMPDSERLAVGARARARVLAEHTAAQRAEQLEQYARAALGVRTAA